MKKQIIIAFVIILLSGISLFIWGVDEQDLGDDYYYLPEYEAVDVGYPGGAVIYKSIQKNVFSDIKIHGDVIGVNNNKDFIIAIQRQKDSSNIEKKHSNIFEDIFLKYFIIVKKSDIVFGPFKKEEYMQKREELGIPKELQLKNKP